MDCKEPLLGSSYNKPEEVPSSEGQQSTESKEKFRLVRKGSSLEKVWRRLKTHFTEQPAYYEKSMNSRNPKEETDLYPESLD